MSVLHVELVTLDPCCAWVTLGTGCATGLENLVDELVLNKVFAFLLMSAIGQSLVCTWYEQCHVCTHDFHSYKDTRLQMLYDSFCSHCPIVFSCPSQIQVCYLSNIPVHS